MSKRPALIFTHGSGGTLKSDAVANFAQGVAPFSPILCFQGNMNLNSRTEMFKAVCKNQGYAKCLGGRSMGARAAVMTATKETTHLVLISYPLHTDKRVRGDIRDQILLDLPATVKVIFVSGDSDVMCTLDRLEMVRSKMRCDSWRVVVQGADHGMNVKPKIGMKDIGMMSGEVVVKWLESSDQDAREGRISWNPEEEKVQWSGWEISTTANAEGEPKTSAPVKILLSTAASVTESKTKSSKKRSILEQQSTPEKAAKKGRTT